MAGRETEGVLVRLGALVRAARVANQLSRAQLGKRSGVSVRFLAQLEKGEANISVLRLEEVAAALGLDLIDLFAPGALPPGSGADRLPARQRIAALLEGRSDTELAEALEYLAARFARATGPLVALLGLRGAGKSSAGELLARRLAVPFEELDALIEARAGLSLVQIFELQGEASYRKLERETLGHFLGTRTQAVLATGGGVVTEPETLALLQKRCVTVWLRARPEEHWERVVQQGDRRPMAGHPAAMHELRALLAARESLYAQAQHVIDTSGRSVDAVAAEIAALVTSDLPRRRSSAA